MITCKLKHLLSLLTFLVIIPSFAFSQGFLHRQGKYIFDGANNEVILRGIGTGNWMLQEGYMMQTAGVAGTQHEFRKKLIETIGIEKTDSFYTAWLGSHFRRIDVDSMKSWGFNSVRVAMHYKWFTLPIEDEPVEGEQTWINTGFTLIDSLLQWCSDNEMYLILDLHGAPGGQGKEKDISDYDPSKPSLWESQANKDKTIALWRKLAERYRNEFWIGGYDLINETNWSFSNGNTPLWNLFKDITSAIREVDTNHMIILEGNWFANNYDGLPPIWDNNMILSFHKYWNYNDAGSIDWMINLRNSRNVPIWLGESGENSNVWFTNCIELCENNHIGWSWWPVKKPKMNNPLQVTVNDDYTNLVDYWKGTAANPGVDAAFQAVLKFAENHKLENCTFQNDVVDAMIRQPFTTETIPFKIYHTGEPVFAVDYNLGRNGFAYFDNDTADYHGSTDEYIDWNKGYSYRNDGVDIEPCDDNDDTNGFSIGWTGDNEWMEYTLVADSTASYTLDVRSASGSGGSKIHLETDGRIISPVVNLPFTSGWYNWTTTTKSGIILEKGTHKIRFVFDQGGSNLNYFRLSDPVSVDSISFHYLSAQTTVDGKNIILTLNKTVTSDISNIEKSNFVVKINNSEVNISSLELDKDDSNKVVISVEEPLYYGGIIKISYSGNLIFHSAQKLENFSNVSVINLLPVRIKLPAKIQSEDFYFNNGLIMQPCDDVDGGYYMGYAAPGDYLDYLVYVQRSGYYIINFRVATIRNNNQLIIQAVDGDTFSNIDTLIFNSTGDWQNWVTLPVNTYLEEGRYTLRMFVKSGEFNTNWFEAKVGTNVGIAEQNTNQLKIYPNPAKQYANISLPFSTNKNSIIKLFDVSGKIVKTITTEGASEIRINISDLSNGVYHIIVENNSKILSKNKLIVY